jgi:hypothetical protein
MAKKAKLDISKYSPKELEKLNKLNKLNNLSNPAYRQKCLKLRPKFEELARKEGVTLKHIFTATPPVAEVRSAHIAKGAKGLGHL